MSNFAVFALLCLVGLTLASTTDDPITRSLRNYEPDIEPYEDRLKPAQPIFNYHKNGVDIKVRVVPAINDSVIDDRFPEFPARELSFCVFEFSARCFRDRLARFIDSIAHLDQITLWGSTVKFVKTKPLPKKSAERRMLDSADSGLGKIDRSIDDFFDSFALRINLPQSAGRRERNQIDIMFDDNSVVEGRGKKGGGGGKGGGKCKKMMMMMMMMGKMKLMGTQYYSSLKFLSLKYEDLFSTL